jgi:xanthine dehydrogenase FAD-binding subunit
MHLWQSFHRPAQIEEALSLLADSPRPSRLVAGGTDLLLDVRFGRSPAPRTLIDVTGIPDLQGIAIGLDGALVVGAAVSLWELTAHPLVQFHAPALVQACRLIGGPQVRNVATLGGNVAHALPAADGVIALLALNAQADLVSREGHHWMPIETLFRGPGDPSFDRERQILVRFSLPGRQPGEGSAFRRVMRPQGLAIAILNMAAWLRLEATGRIAAARLAIGPSGPTPNRARAAEAALQGRDLSPATLEEVRLALREDVHLRSSPHRASSEYRYHLMDQLLPQVLYAAWAEAARTHAPAIEHGHE